MTFEHLLLVSGLLLIISVLASKISTKFGIPALIIFIGIGMLAGSDGPGRIAFTDAVLAHNLGVIALVLILFGGGLDTHWSSIKKIFFSGVSLATIGVVITALIVGVCAHYVLGFSILEGVLLGAIVSSTDAAAVFGVLRAQRLKLTGKLGALLELESGGNDPMAVFLTIALTQLIMHPSTDVNYLVYELIFGFLIGGLGGVALGRFAGFLINRMHLAYDGLYNVFTIGLALLSYAGIEAIGGNGFLGVYACGVALSSKNFVHRLSLIQFHEGIAWLMQIMMFLSLGLLVFPSQLMQQISSGLIIAVILVVVARPAAVYVSLFFAKSFSPREKAFISWVGLRGAVPIILSTIPLMQAVPAAPMIFNVVFFAVIVSVLVQGTAIRWVAKWLGVISDEDDHVVERRVHSLKLEVRVPPHADAVGKSVVELKLSPSILLVLLTRGTESSIPRGSTVLEAGDLILVQADPEAAEEVRRVFTSPPTLVTL